MTHKTDITGKRFGMLTATKPVGQDKHRTTLWHCRCECGGERVMTISALKQRKYPNCGCQLSEIRSRGSRKTSGIALRNNVVYQYQRNAAAKGLAFELTAEECHMLFDGACDYCGQPPSLTITRSNYYGSFTYNGIDRVDNRRGYTGDNVVSCCARCNKQKSNLAREEFLGWVLDIAKHQGWCHADISV